MPSPYLLFIKAFRAKTTLFKPVPIAASSGSLTTINSQSLFTVSQSSQLTSETETSNERDNKEVHPVYVSLPSSHTAPLIHEDLPSQSITDTPIPAQLECSRRYMVLSDLTIIRKLGEGSSGKVFQVRDNVTKGTLALKVIKKGAISTRALEAVLAEQSTMQSTIGCSQLLSLDASFHDSRNFYLAMRYTPTGDLQAEIERCRTLSPQRARFYMAELILGLNALHKLGIIHRDIKPANILLSPAGHVIIADFGLARNFQAHPKLSKRPNSNKPLSSNYTRSWCGTFAFMSPELHHGLPYSFGADFWAAGVTLFVMLCGDLPWDGDSRKETADLITFTPLPFGDNSHVEFVSKNFLNHLLAKHPHHRLTFQEIKSHPYFWSIDWEKMAAGEMEAPAVLGPDKLTKPTALDLYVAAGDPIDATNDPFPEFTFASPRMVDAIAFARSEDDQRALHKVPQGPKSRPIFKLFRTTASNSKHSSKGQNIPKPSNTNKAQSPFNRLNKRTKAIFSKAV